MEQKFLKTRRQFTIFTIGIALVCSLLSSLTVYGIAQHRLSQKLSAAQISQLTANKPEVNQYFASQQEYHAHFESIATLIQDQERAQISRTIPILLAGTFVISGLLGWGLAQKFLRPIRESYSRQQRFMQDAAHELRNPLAAMSSMIQQASKGRGKNTKDHKKLLSSLNKQTKHISAIATDLLLLERQEYRGTEQTDLVDLLTDVIEQLYQQSSKKNLTVQIYAPKQLNMPIEPQHFVYIARNLIENAIKFSVAGGKPIEVALKPSRAGWQLSVVDYGIGIPREDVANITQRFYRASNATATEGTGLGMAIVAKFTNLYGGKLEIKSQVGQGSTFTLIV